MPGEEGFPKRIDNVEEARTVAETEKSLRDAAREPGIASYAKVALDQAAEQTGDQMLAALEKWKSFVGKETVNGLAMSMKWNEELDRYFFSFPEISMDENNAGNYGRRMNITDQKTAETVFNFARKEAQKEADPFKIFSSVAKFTDGLYHD